MCGMMGIIYSRTLDSSNEYTRPWENANILALDGVRDFFSQKKKGRDAESLGHGKLASSACQIAPERSLRIKDQSCPTGCRCARCALCRA